MLDHMMARVTAFCGQEHSRLFQQWIGHIQKPRAPGALSLPPLGPLCALFMPRDPAWARTLDAALYSRYATFLCGSEAHMAEVWELAK